MTKDKSAKPNHGFYLLWEFFKFFWNMSSHLKILFYVRSNIFQEFRNILPVIP